jgi:phosphatidylglycerol---prolipoprotein diacylglyceryl transferase
MWPTLLKIGNFEITTFGLMMFVAFLAAGYVTSRQFRRYGLREDDASAVLLAAAVGGILGAKIYYAILYRDFSAVFSRAGLVWYGGLIGGALAVSAVFLWKKIPYLTAADAASPGLALGYALGRVGCFLVGDDYGRPTDSFVGIAFPRGTPPTTADALRQYGVNVDPSIPGATVLRVHPTQLYETGAGLIIFAILMAMARRRHPAGRVFAAFLVLAGLERFLVEFVRAKDDRFLGDFTIAQLISVILIVIGILLFVIRGRGPMVAATPETSHP